MKKDLNNNIDVADKMLSNHSRMRNAFFYTPPLRADGRRSYEDRYSMDERFEYNGHAYEYHARCSCSCKNVYFNDYFLYDGKKTTSTRISNVLKKMEDELKACSEEEQECEQ